MGVQLWQKNLFHRTNIWTRQHHETMTTLQRQLKSIIQLSKYPWLFLNDYHPLYYILIIWFFYSIILKHRKYWTYDRRFIELLLGQFFYKYNTIIKSKLIDHWQSNNCRIYCYIISHIKQPDIGCMIFQKKKRKDLFKETFLINLVNTTTNRSIVTNCMVHVPRKQHPRAVPHFQRFHSRSLPRGDIDVIPFPPRDCSCSPIMIDDFSLSAPVSPSTALHNKERPAGARWLTRGTVITRATAQRTLGEARQIALLHLVPPHHGMKLTRVPSSPLLLTIGERL